MQPLEQLERLCEEVFHIIWGDYALYAVQAGTEGAEDAFLQGRPCALLYEGIYRAKQAILEGRGDAEALLERICQNYEAIAEYVAKAMFRQGAHAAQHIGLPSE